MKLRFTPRRWKDNVHIGDGRVIRPDPEKVAPDGGPAPVFIDIDDDALAAKLMEHAQIERAPGRPGRAKFDHLKDDDA